MARARKTKTDITEAPTATKVTKTRSASGSKSNSNTKAAPNKGRTTKNRAEEVVKVTEVNDGEGATAEKEDSLLEFGTDSDESQEFFEFEDIQSTKKSSAVSAGIAKNAKTTVGTIKRDHIQHNQKEKVEHGAAFVKKITGTLALKRISKSLEISSNEIPVAASSQQIVDLINKLTSTTQDEIFHAYKVKAESQLNEHQRLVDELQQELLAKEAIIENLKQAKKTDLQIQTPMQNVYKSPIRRKNQSSSIDESMITQDELSKELETIGITLDMVELLTGLRIVNYEEDDVKFHFDISQTSSSDTIGEGGVAEALNITYRLIISKEFKSTAEINYIPTFLKEKNTNNDKLRDILPEYFFGNLTFPYSTLSLFYTKISKALKKGVKGN